MLVEVFSAGPENGINGVEVKNGSEECNRKLSESMINLLDWIKRVCPDNVSTEAARSLNRSVNMPSVS